MVKRTPFHALRDTLEFARLQAIRELASPGETTPSIFTETLRRVAFLQVALVAFREKLATHGVKIGGGGEQRLHSVARHPNDDMRKLSGVCGKDHYPKGSEQQRCARGGRICVVSESPVVDVACYIRLSWPWRAA